jgi:hypothetical protein
VDATISHHANPHHTFVLGQGPGVGRGQDRDHRSVEGKEILHAGGVTVVVLVIVRYQKMTALMVHVGVLGHPNQMSSVAEDVVNYNVDEVEVGDEDVVMIRMQRTSQGIKLLV